MEHLEDNEIPKKITLDDYEYVYKGKKTRYNYAYRCSNRKCGVHINLDEINVKKIIQKENASNIIYTIVSNKEHNCKSNIRETSPDNVKNKDNDLQLAEDLIKNNLEKTIEWHIINLKNNNIILKTNQIKYILQKNRDFYYPKDDIYLLDISKIKINILEGNNNMKEMNYCLTKQYITNKKKNRQEYYILFSTLIQLNQFKECDIIYMDGTFKCSPKNFYQLYNILGRDEKTKVTIPLCHIIMPHKSYDLDYNIFSLLKSTLEKNNIIINLKKICFMLDFEKGSRKALKAIFPKINLIGCYYHYSKVLWTKLGLLKSKIFYDTYVLIFGFKLYQFIAETDKKII